MRRSVLAVILVTSTSVPIAVHAQALDTLQATAVLERVRSGGGISLAAAFLTQLDHPRPTGELDAFADSLVKIGSSYRRGDPRSLQASARVARVSLVLSAQPEWLAEQAAELAERGLPPPTPYPRAFEALVRVFEQSTTPGVRGGTLSLLTNLPDTARVVAFLSDLATDPATDRGDAYAAVQRLSMDTGDPGVARLRALFETDAIPDPFVRERVRAMATGRGWREGPP